MLRFERVYAIQSELYAVGREDERERVVGILEKLRDEFPFATGILSRAIVDVKNHDGDYIKLGENKV